MKNTFNSKNKRILIIVLVLVLGIGISLAFFIPQIMSGDSVDADIISETTDNLTFEVTNDMSLKITQKNLAQGLGNLSDSSQAIARLRANSTDNIANYTYNVYLLIDKNEYIYTTEDEKPEIIMNIIDPNDSEVTTIDGLNHVTVGDISGFDITTKKGIIDIATNYAISSNSSTTATVHEWDVTLYFVNLETSQELNENKAMSAKLLIQQNEYITLANHVKGLYTVDGENGLYLHDADLANGANDGSYRYAGASEDVNNYVCFASDEEICPDDNLYRIVGVFGDNVKLIKSNYATSTQLGTDGEYYGAYDYGSSTYKGTNYDNIASYSWGVSYNENFWENSELNTVNLNTNYIAYLNGINTKWANMIAETTWKIGGNYYHNIISTTIPNVYQNEIISPSENTTYPAEIGLMYVSDYGYAASPINWTSEAFDYNDSAKSSNWMYMGLHEWTISRSSDSTGISFYVHNNGAVYMYEAGYLCGGCVDGDASVRPSFSLKSTVGYSGTGSGSKINPYRLQ